MSFEENITELERLLFLKLSEKHSNAEEGLRKTLHRHATINCGFLSVGELATCLFNILNGFTDEQVYKLAAAQDTNGDGNVNVNEFVSKIIRPQRLPQHNNTTQVSNNRYWEMQKHSDNRQGAVIYGSSSPGIDLMGSDFSALNLQSKPTRAQDEWINMSDEYAGPQQYSYKQGSDLYGSGPSFFEPPRQDFAARDVQRSNQSPRALSMHLAHARLPHSHNDLWDSIQMALVKLASQLTDNYNIIEMLTEISCTQQHQGFNSFLSYMHELGRNEKKQLLSKVLPFMAAIALEVTRLFDRPLPLLIQNKPQHIELTQRQCCCLLSLAFFNAFPDPPSRRMPDRLSFCQVLASEKEKIKCFMCYFLVMSERAKADPDYWGLHVLTFVRKVAILGDRRSPIDFLRQCRSPLLPLQVYETGAIENSNGFLQADFANEYIGGGVLRRGCVQEEIRFLISPECVVSLLLCERLDHNEAVAIIGAERFSNYRGYGRQFSFAGRYSSRNNSEALDDVVVAFDAIPVKADPRAQYRMDWLLRDFGKVYAALCFHPLIDTRWESPRPFATGNWGCGAFGGDPQLKCLIQWAIASLTNRRVTYFRYREQKLLHLNDAVKRIANKVTVGQLCALILRFGREARYNESVFDFVMRNLS